MSELPPPGSTARTRVRRLPDKAVTVRDTAYAILDAGLVAHVAVVTDGQPYVVPVGYARVGDEVRGVGGHAPILPHPTFPSPRPPASTPRVRRAA